MKLKCLVVDDEDLARTLVENYIKDVGFLEHSASCSNAIEALNYLTKNSVDLMFLDIDMPKLDGLSFLKTLKNPPLVIITTAYREYAIEGYELDVVDYLSKPFSFERFLAALNKASGRLKQPEIQTITINEEKPRDPFIFIKSDKVIYRVNLDEILFVEAVGDYVKIITTKKSLISYMYLKDVEKMLPPHLFPRVHRSFIASISKIEKVEGNMITIDDSIIPIGKNYKENFMKLLG
jgi:DNA-binding LytR/AlgR family response regulator